MKVAIATTNHFCFYNEILNAVNLGKYGLQLFFDDIEKLSLILIRFWLADLLAICPTN